MKIIEPTPPVSLLGYIGINKKSKSEKFKDVLLTLRGRDAISLAFNHFKLEENDTVLLPGYLCEVIHSPLTKKYNIEYYDIEKDFSINPDTIESFFSRQKVKILYIIHYFGFLQKHLKQISDLCKKYGVFLIEDHAHSALSDFSYDYADAMIFSFRKIFPIPDGGGLWLKDSIDLKFDKRSILYSSLISFLIILHRSRIGRSKMLKAKANKMGQSMTSSTFEGSSKINPKPISYLSGKIVKNSDIEKLVAIRRDIYNKWLELFSESRFKPLYSSLPDDVCPQGFPIRIKNPDDVMANLQEQNIILKIHWSLRQEMMQKCPTSFSISKSIITLPIYPELSEHDMEKILRLVTQYGIPMDESN